MLVEAVARGLDREMRHALARERREIGVELHRVGRGQAGLAAEAGRDDAERADARGLQAERRPDLAHEMDGRALAVGAGDGGDGRGLQAGESRRHQRDAPARIVVAQHDDALVERRQDGVGRGEDRRGAALHGVADEARAVGLGAGEGGEQETGLDLAGVERQAGHLRDRAAAARPMSSLSRNATHSGDRRLTRRRRQRLALAAARPRPPRR